MKTKFAIVAIAAAVFTTPLLANASAGAGPSAAPWGAQTFYMTDDAASVTARQHATTNLATNAFEGADRAQ